MYQQKWSTMQSNLLYIISYLPITENQNIILHIHAHI